MGNDAALCDAIRAGICDGVVSGVACALPELMSDLFRYKAGSVGFAAAESLLLEFIERIKPLPTPWGLKVASHVRGIAPQEYALPLSPERQAEIEALSTWVQANLPALSRDRVNSHEVTVP